MTALSKQDVHEYQNSLFDDLLLSTNTVEKFDIDAKGKRIIRTVITRKGQTIETAVPLSSVLTDAIDPCAQFDHSWLRLKEWPSDSTNDHTAHPIRLVDLFSGCGGLSLGVQEACRALGLATTHVLAADMHQASLNTYAANFIPEIDTEQRLQDKRLLSDPIDQVINGELGANPTPTERELLHNIGSVDILVGGPPCQGHSNLNNHTRRNDEKNQLILRMARFAELTEATHIIIENVPTVKRDKTNSLLKTYRKLAELGYNLDQNIDEIESLNAADYGVAQLRRRFFLIASKTRDVRSVRDLIRAHAVDHRTFNWACGDLKDVQSTDLFDTPPETSQINQDRIEYLFVNNKYELDNKERPDCHKEGHSYPSVYGRLWPDRPSPTITRGFGGMGQGRYVHPTKKRLITPHEAARLQFFPDYFRFQAEHRKHLQHMIGNAVPPKLAYLIALHLLR